ncbi:MAG: hypothetical protein A2Y07_01180 [Planctomycetes bacterium GWF2_50_10]|nr:MAG: hypothetical protein A2Y07_01180 [Planctomycetes bacterium GWF2_50_10]
MSTLNVEQRRKSSFVHQNPNLVENALLSLDEAAACLRMSRRTFYRKRPQLVASGLKQVRDQKRYKFPASSVRQFIDTAVKTGTLVRN